jgi:sugar/nucleoside kinase (ribokinase family)
MDLRRTGLPAGCHVDGLHVAPQTAQGQLRALEDARSAGVTTLDCMVEPYIDLEPYRDGRALAGVTAFLPSEHEVTAIWGDVDALELARRLHERSGVQVVIITRGRSGADVVTRDRVVRVPAAPTSEIDATGAGDAFAGGFLVGLIEHADPVRAAVWGSVSASYVVETRGPLEALDRLDPADASRRAAQLSTRVEEKAH